MNKEIRQAYAILKKVYFQQSYAGIELNKTISRERENSNTKLVTKIVYGVIENDIQLQYIIDLFTKAKPEDEINLLLKIGTYIIKNINSIPEFACVNEIVEIAKAIKNTKIAGFVNATLKNICKTKVKFPDRNKNIIKYFSVIYSYPEWVIEELLREHDENFVENLLAHELTTLTHIRILTERISVEDFIKILDEKKIEYHKSAYDNTFYVEYSSLIKMSELHDKYIVQGLPSIITANNVPKESKLILDLCASPGGKSVLMAQNNPDSIIYACDVSDNRVELINKYAKSYDVTNIKIFQNDATILKEDWIEKFDTVLCDVPCSNLGIANKKPDVLLNRSKESVGELKDIQLNILQTASDYVKKGGVLIYSTCSIMKEENEKVIGKFLQSHNNFVLTEVDTHGVEVEKYHNLCTFYPHISNCEGFFIGRLKKK